MYGLTWDFWTIFWFFWIVAVPVALLVWMTLWIVQNYNRDLEQRKELENDKAQREDQG